MKIPKTFLEIGVIFEKVKGIKNFYLGRTFGSDGSIADVFTSQVLLNRIENASELFIESTVQGVLKRPKASHVLKILLRHGEQAVPAFIVLCSSNSTVLLKSILNFMLNHSPGIKNNLKTVFADFNDLTISAINEIMPWVSKKTCWFNFTRAITQKWKSLNLPKRNENLHVLLRLIYILPTVAVDNYDEAVLHIMNELKKVESSNSNFKHFMSYLMDV
ncbi:uncharacterized protein LOC123261352 [Cotesia glomerata]|uniref:uncharacterized protein LOC123261352 n=1 Tax=Cotesia glomerata TaxID=32391 RepID=UPI001D01C7C2|nr:uncharacterized protein LOC123261352 [Cotesia glomerata]